MKIPNIDTKKGVEPITVLPDDMLVEAYLFLRPSADDMELARLLQYAEPDAKKAGSILRRCLEGKARLIPFYPGISNKKEPDGAKVVGSIIDGVLYIV